MTATQAKPAPRRRTRTETPAPRIRKATSRLKAPRAGTAPAPGVAAETARTDITPEERYHMIESAAYFRSQGRGFVPGAEMEDWLAAEAAIDELILDRGQG